MFLEGLIRERKGGKRQERVIGSIAFLEDCFERILRRREYD